MSARYTSDADDIEYIRDPDDRMGLASELDRDAALPSGAIDTDYRSGPQELWIDPDDDQSIYIVDGNRAERWPRADSILCF